MYLLTQVCTNLLNRNCFFNLLLTYQSIPIIVKYLLAHQKLFSQPLKTPESFLHLGIQIQNSEPARSRLAADEAGVTAGARGEVSRRQMRQPAPSLGAACPRARCAPARPQSAAASRRCHTSVRLRAKTHATRVIRNTSATSTNSDIFYTVIV